MTATYNPAEVERLLAGVRPHVEVLSADVIRTGPLEQAVRRASRDGGGEDGRAPPPSEVGNVSDPIRVAFDIGGVLSKYPDVLRRMTTALQAGGALVYVITDMSDKPDVLRQLERNGFGHIPEDRVHCADYNAHGEGCKAELLGSLGIDVFLDDFVGYVAAGGCPVRLLVMPDASKPYYADEWQSDGVPEFGRRTYRGGKP